MWEGNAAGPASVSSLALDKSLKHYKTVIMTPTYLEDELGGLY